MNHHDFWDGCSWCARETVYPDHLNHFSPCYPHQVTFLYVRRVGVVLLFMKELHALNIPTFVVLCCFLFPVNPFNCLFLHFSCALTEGCADHLESSQVLIMTGFSTDWFLTLSLIILPFLPIQYLTVSLVLWPSFCGLLPHTMLRGSTPRHFNNTHINNRF